MKFRFVKALLPGNQSSDKEMGALLQNQKPTKDDSKVAGQQDLKEEPRDKIVTDAIVATTVLHDDILNKIPKKLKLLDEVSQACIPDELQPVISPMQDIPLPNMKRDFAASIRVATFLIRLLPLLACFKTSNQFRVLVLQVKIKEADRDRIMQCLDVILSYDSQDTWTGQETVLVQLGDILRAEE
uniref:Uncharacterized protein n=1 Tax=Tanacetum cinerariifolium TaxID=118510 RepID=A0A6L2LMG7_TANCI|nr:hypothetical protein [Tanacetum cinerariifolium]